MKPAKTLSALLFLILAAAVWADKHYTLPKVRIEAQVLPDAGLQIQESRTYRFSGSFTYAYRTFPKNDVIRYSGFELWEGERAYSRDDSKAPYTFRVVEEKEQWRVTWYYKSRDESRTFTVRYKVEELIRRHPDAGVLYYQFIGSEWKLKQSDIRILIKPPAEMAAGAVREWVHGPLWAQSRIETDGTIEVECSTLPARTYLEVRALYPAEAFMAGPMFDEPVVEKILQEESAWAQKANELRQKEAARREKLAAIRERIKPALAVLFFLAAVIWWMIFDRYGRRPLTLSSQGSVGDIPDDTPPAVVSYLLNHRMITSRDLAATVMDLAARGLITISEEKESKSLFGKPYSKTRYTLQLNRKAWQQRQAELMPFEQALVTFFFDDLFSGQDAFEMSALRKESGRVQKFFSQWQKMVTAAALEKNYYEAVGSRGMVLGLLVSGVVLILGVISVILGQLWGIALIIEAIVLFVASLFIQHRTADGERAYVRWKALKSYLKKYQFRSLEKSSLLSRLDRYLVYGLVFGLYKKHYQQLTASLGSGQESVYLPWFVAHGGSGGLTPASFSASFSSMVSSMTSASGFGGGAATGGGGGAGGGGGGAG
ncbi:MAG TPA: DUF2207 domain-containing protein [bacterium]|nr:DUF2207 domain-containing protein [bacterium]